MSISLHPGTISSDLARNAGVAMKIFGRLITYPTSYGAITSLYAGTTPAAAELNGKVGIIPASRICPWLVNLFTRNQMFFFPVSHCLGTRHTSAQEGTRSRAREETVGMV